MFALRSIALGTAAVAFAFVVGCDSTPEVQPGSESVYGPLVADPNEIVLSVPGMV